jgi:hypothetical protein
MIPPQQIDPAPTAGTAIRPGLPPVLATEKSHSKVGIASFVTALAVWLLFGAIMAISTYQRSAEIGDGLSVRPPTANAWVFPAVFPLYAGILVAIGLGIASLCERQKKHVFGVLGLSLAAFQLACAVALIVLGVVNAASARARLAPAVTQVELDDQVGVTLEADEGVHISDAARERLRHAIENKIQAAKLGHAPTRPAKQFLVAVTLKNYGDLPAAGPGQFEIDVAEAVYVMPGRGLVCSVGTGAVGPMATMKLAEIEESAANAAAHSLNIPSMWIKPPPEKVGP